MSDLVTVDDLAYGQLDYSSTPTLFWNAIDLPDDPNVWDGGVNAATAAGLSVMFSFTGASPPTKPLHIKLLHKFLHQARKYLSLVASSPPPTARSSHYRCTASAHRSCKLSFLTT